jgi:hypothetical protein
MQSKSANLGVIAGALAVGLLLGRRWSAAPETVHPPMSANPDVPALAGAVAQTTDVATLNICDVVKGS